MADVGKQSEPSMEEILASIRRIIAEEDDRTDHATAPAAKPAAQAAPPAPSPAEIEDSILELTERVDDDLLPKSPPPAPAPAPTQPGFGSGRLTRPPPLKGGAAPGEAAATKRLVSESTVASSVATLAQLSGVGHNSRQQELPLGDISGTLEDMVRDLVRPHLKEWLDAHLPRIVERLVREEINRLVRDVEER
jgi:uncharacterized protein